MSNKSTSPKGGKRGCLCKDGTYNKECCDGELQSQGIGSLVEGENHTIVNTNEERVITTN